MDTTPTIPAGDSDRELRIARIVGDFVDRLSRGEAGDIEGLLKQHPDVAPELEEELRTLESIGTAVEENEPRFRFGDFEILREIGRGGMGVVYEAWQLSLDRGVALKILPDAKLPDPKAVARFQREAKVAASLHHANIVPVYAMGVEGGTPYFAMELCEGETLQQILQRLGSYASLENGASIETLLFGPKPGAPRSPGDRPDTPKSPRVRGNGEESPLRPAGGKSSFGRGGRGSGGRTSRAYCFEAAGLIAGAAEGLQHAHDLQVIHRDIKPSNLILDIDGRLRILDFSLAWVADDQNLTLTKDRVGTPLYMSPEQARGDKELGFATDIYSLGATLYEVLTWHPPFEAEDHHTILHQVVHKDPIPPRRVNRSVPKDLETIVLKCLRKHPKDRYGTAEALAQDLRRFLRGAPIEARPQPLVEKLSRRAWHSRRGVAAWTTGVALIASLIVLLGFHRANTATRDIEEYEGKVLTAVDWLMRSDLRSPVVVLGKTKADVLPWDIEPERPIQRSPEPGGVTVLMRAGCELPDPADEDGAETNDSADPTAGELDRAQKLLQEAVGILPNRPDAHYVLARVFQKQGRTEEALSSLAKATGPNPRFVPGLALCASLLKQDGNAGARELAERTARLAEGSWAEHWLQAQAAFESGDWETATRGYEAVLSRAIGNEEVPRYVGSELESLVRAGLSNLRARKFEKAIEHLGAARNKFGGFLEIDILLAKAYHLAGLGKSAQRSDALLLKRFGETTGNAREGIAVAAVKAYLELGELRKAREWVGRLAEGPTRAHLTGLVLRHSGRLGLRDDVTAVLDAESVARISGDKAWAHICLANAYLSVRYFEDAEKAFGKARELSPRDPRPLVGLGISSYLQGRLEAARGRLDAARQMDRGFVPTYYNLGVVLTSQGLFEEAGRAYEDALRLDRGHALSRNNLGTILDQRGLLFEATQEYERAVEAAPLLGLVHYNLARGLQRLGDYRRASAEYREAIWLGSNGAAVYKNLANCLFRLRRLDEASIEYRTALTLDPRCGRTYHGLGVTLLHLYRKEDALAPLERAVELEPSWVDARNNYASTLKGLGRLDEAVAEYLKVIAADPGFVHSYNDLANLFLRERRPLPEGGKLVELLRLLEDATRLPGADRAIDALIAKCRDALSPDLATLASIDDFLDRPEMLVTADADWHYWPGVAEPSPDSEWTAEDFSDASWSVGKSGFGVNEGEGVLTAMGSAGGAYTSLYLRRRFTIPDPTRLREIAIRVRSSGGWIAYLNGVEWCRMRAGPSGNRMGHEDVAESGEDQIWIPREVRAEAHLLHTGDNVLAIQALRPPRTNSPFWIQPALAAVPRFDDRAADRAREFLRGFRGTALGEDAPNRLDYFEAGILERLGFHEKAEPLYQRLSQQEIEADLNRPEPALRAASCLLVQGRTEEAVAVLRQGLDLTQPSHLLRFRKWLQISLGEMERSPGEILKDLGPPPENALDPVAEALWALGEQEAGRPLRINCGGIDFPDRDGRTWTKDMLFLGGRKFFLFTLEEKGVDLESAPLYQTERYFWEPYPIAPGYEIPLAKGTYKVTLHFVEGHWSEGGSRSFDIRLEGKTVRKDYEPLRAGFGIPEEIPFEGVQIDDGALNIDFIRRVENPKISAIEIERI